MVSKFVQVKTQVSKLYGETELPEVLETQRSFQKYYFMNTKTGCFVSQTRTWGPFEPENSEKHEGHPYGPALPRNMVLWLSSLYHRTEEPGGRCVPAKPVSFS